MNIKTLLLSSTIATSLLLGACNTMEDDKEGMKKETKSESKMENKNTENTKVMKEGMFKGENKEQVEGKAMIKNNKLMLKDFSSSKGPDLHVYLTKDGDIKKGKKIDMVKYDKAEQSFDLKGINAKDYNTVTIYCDKAHVTFGSAMLK
ncbi:DM13 domain-containing protein [Staphylococcus gallinarum]|uniref:DM13 domain-containing protein n=1 Tax=Staphylococcus gallinarum TaxID=1293 RepID=UPI001E6146B2|nr:DM13 domain-containing protein [Staphylococcus gallinarum]MCD8899577.1 DM13 domain-containing protein [Staphylococcus gallinarum]